MARPLLIVTTILFVGSVAFGAQPVYLTLQIDGNDIKGYSRVRNMERADTIECLSFNDSVYHSILREIGFKKNLSSRVVRTECARGNGWAGPGFGKKLSWSRENEVWLALSVREE